MKGRRKQAERSNKPHKTDSRENKNPQEDKNNYKKKIQINHRSKKNTANQFKPWKLKKKVFKVKQKQPPADAKSPQRPKTISQRR